ncbi:E2 [Eidolon helvum papillomavirus 3]|uniref:Regulatory protein E2 n=1 Tax=Eidolon helvum papillomavirus 3 TaxID=1335477 RepID=A0A1P8YVV7_9PAPI|nr:E2 [Eidolon helvum papillomavirus 3]AQA28212.1 E2 [Eidolon helvum papillomavirus 3]
MEALRERFDVLQERILKHYELDSQKLADHCEYWRAVRKENALLHYARDKGVKTLGHMPVPAAQVSQARARDAIAMQLAAESLERSGFGAEPWSLQELSREAYTAAPRNCFKKRGYTVLVMYDNSEENCMEYTGWEDIYVQEDDDVWLKVKGLVDIYGLYYESEGLKEYYVTFAQDAETYSKTGLYTVKYKSEVLTNFHPVSSSTPRSPRARRQREESPGSLPAGQGEGEGEGAQTPPSKRRRGLPDQGGSPTRSSNPERRWPGQGQRQGEGEGGRPSQSPTRGSAGRAPRRAARSAGPGAQGRGRRCRPDQAASTLAPILIVRGNGNGLKCLRYRWHRDHSALFTSVSTTFRWLRAGLTDREGNAEVIVRFNTDKQREDVLDCGAVPETVQYLCGTMPFFS